MRERGELRQKLEGIHKLQASELESKTYSIFPRRIRCGAFVGAFHAQLIPSPPRSIIEIINDLGSAGTWRSPQYLFQATYDELQADLAFDTQPIPLSTPYINDVWSAVITAFSPRYLLGSTYDELQAELCRLRASIRLLNHEIALALRAFRSLASTVTLVAQQENFFTLHSFHPPHSHPNWGSRM